MDIDLFLESIKAKFSVIGLEIEEEQAKKLYQFMEILIEENNKINLTSITEPEEIMTKHFLDSMMISKFIENGKKIIDVGTGAGFPGMPLAICREDIRVSLLDSLNKRVEFLKKVEQECGINNIETIWGRAEDVARDEKNREAFDIAVSRAVAPLNVLLEYLLPFVKVGGKCICMKGPNYKEEITKVDIALKKLGGKIESVEEINVMNMNRAIIVVGKVEKTKSEYPRKAGVPSKKPL